MPSDEEDCDEEVSGREFVRLKAAELRDKALHGSYDADSTFDFGIFEVCLHVVCLCCW